MGCLSSPPQPGLVILEIAWDTFSDIHLFGNFIGNSILLSEPK